MEIGGGVWGAPPPQFNINALQPFFSYNYETCLKIFTCRRTTCVGTITGGQSFRGQWRHPLKWPRTAIFICPRFGTPEAFISALTSVLAWSLAPHCHAVNGSGVPTQRSQRFASILPTAQDCAIAKYYTMSLWSQLTFCHAYPTSSAGAFSLLKFVL